MLYSLTKYGKPVLLWDKEISLPLKLLIAASNELPTQGEGLEALWDRFIIRIECSNIKQERNFFAMLTDSNSEAEILVSQKLQITSDEYNEWSKAIDTIEVSQDVLKSIGVIRKAIGSVPVTSSDEHHNVYVSDRRWKKIVRLLRTTSIIMSMSATDDGRRLSDCSEPQHSSTTGHQSLQQTWFPYTTVFGRSQMKPKVSGILLFSHFSPNSLPILQTSS